MQPHGPSIKMLSNPCTYTNAFCRPEPKVTTLLHIRCLFHAWTTKDLSIGMLGFQVRPRQVVLPLDTRLLQIPQGHPKGCPALPTLGESAFNFSKGRIEKLGIDVLEIQVGLGFKHNRVVYFFT